MVRHNDVQGCVTVVWTENQDGRNITKQRWNISPGSFSTRSKKSAFLRVGEEMSHNAPLVETLMREEIAYMGDPIKALSKIAKKAQ